MVGFLTCFPHSETSAYYPEDSHGATAKPLKWKTQPIVFTALKEKRFYHSRVQVQCGIAYIELVYCVSV